MTPTTDPILNSVETGLYTVFKQFQNSVEDAIVGSGSRSQNPTLFFHSEQLCLYTVFKQFRNSVLPFLAWSERDLQQSINSVHTCFSTVLCWFLAAEK